MHNLQVQYIVLVYEKCVDEAHVPVHSHTRHCTWSSSNLHMYVEQCLHYKVTTLLLHIGCYILLTSLQ